MNAIYLSFVTMLPLKHVVYLETGKICAKRIHDFFQGNIGAAGITWIWVVYNSLSKTIGKESKRYETLGDVVVLTIILLKCAVDFSWHHSRSPKGPITRNAPRSHVKWCEASAGVKEATVRSLMKHWQFVRWCMCFLSPGFICNSNFPTFCSVCWERILWF